VREELTVVGWPSTVVTILEVIQDVDWLSVPAALTGDENDEDGSEVSGGGVGEFVVSVVSVVLYARSRYNAMLRGRI
jgi:hypothetical protein